MKSNRPEQGHTGGVAVDAIPASNRPQLSRSKESRNRSLRDRLQNAADVMIGRIEQTGTTPVATEEQTSQRSNLITRNKRHPLAKISVGRYRIAYVKLHGLPGAVRDPR